MLVDVSHVVEHGMITYKGLPAPLLCDFLSREQSRSLYAPAFVFERDGDQEFFSIAASALSGAGGDPAWQWVEFSPAEFVAALADLRASFAAALRQASPTAAEAWLARFDRL
jgi:hypothetical protein